MRKRNASDNEERIAARSEAAGDARVKTAQRMSLFIFQEPGAESLIRRLCRRGRFRLDA